MRFIFKTHYEQDLRLAKHGGHVFWYGLLILALLAAPWVVQEYWLAQLTFVMIYSIAGLGLMLLAGFTGQFSIGHAAFLGVGAYTHAVLTNMGFPFPIALVLAATLAAARSSPRLGLLLVVPTLLLTIGVVYCQMHYGVDALGGLAVGADSPRFRG